MRGIFAISINNNNNTIIIEDLVHLISSVYAYDSKGCLECPIPDVWNISSEQDDIHPWAEPLKADEIDVYRDEINFNSISANVIDSFSEFSSYLRGE